MCARAQALAISPGKVPSLSDYFTACTHQRFFLVTICVAPTADSH
jgi:hypothetical protein